MDIQYIIELFELDLCQSFVKLIVIIRKEDFKMTKVNTVLIASGSGTDADSIMKAYAFGHISDINLKVLVSTKSGAGCLDKAKSLGVSTKVIDRREFTSIENFNWAVSNFLEKVDAKLVFLVGCVVKIFPMKGISIYNIHPADPHKFGGKKMYGLEVHRRVILDIVDQIEHGKKSWDDTFYTYPTIHQVNIEYDSGAPFLWCQLPIPFLIIYNYLNADPEENRLDVAARELQDFVLPNEWIMLPAAVQMAARIITEKEKY